MEKQPDNDSSELESSGKSSDEPITKEIPAAVTAVCHDESLTSILKTVINDSDSDSQTAALATEPVTQTISAENSSNTEPFISSSGQTSATTCSEAITVASEAVISQTEVAVNSSFTTNEVPPNKVITKYCSHRNCKNAKQMNILDVN